MAAYFSITLYFYPAYFTSQFHVPKPLPTIINFTVDPSYVRIGKWFNISIAGTNNGDDAFFQIVSVSFPNLTSSGKGTLTIRNHNFTHSPILIVRGAKIEPRYGGESNIFIAKYPSVEFYSRPWKTDTVYQAQIELRLTFEGRFVIYVKAISLPPVDDSSHYPQTGIKDDRQEFVEPYFIDIHK